MPSWQKLGNDRAIKTPFVVGQGLALSLAVSLLLILPITAPASQALIGSGWGANGSGQCDLSTSLPGFGGRRRGSAARSGWPILLLRSEPNARVHVLSAAHRPAHRGCLGGFAGRAELVGRCKESACSPRWSCGRIHFAARGKVPGSKVARGAIPRRTNQGQRQHTQRNPGERG
jgi:hypothetical protein